MKPMLKCLTVLCLCLLILPSAGCRGQSPLHRDETGSTPESVSFTDDLGREITVRRPVRVAALLGSFADMWLLAGGTVCAAADDAWEDFCLPLGGDVLNLGSAHRPNRETLLRSDPDLVLASSRLTRQRELQDTLESAGIPVAYFDVGDFSSYLRVLEIMTGITGQSDRFDTYGLSQQAEIRAILDRRRGETPQTVLVMRASASSIRAKNSSGTMLGSMLKDFGCINIADGQSALLENLNIESIVRLNPDRIFFVETGDDPDGIRRNVEQMFRENPLWGELSAVKENRVHFMDKHLYHLKPNAAFHTAYENLEKILYETD